MKGALVVCSAEVLFLRLVEQVAVDRGLRPSVFEESVQIRDRFGRLFTAFDTGVPDLEWHDMPRIRALLYSGFRAYSVECRWEDFFCEILRDVGSIAPSMLIIDGDGRVFRANELDPGLIVL